MKKVKITCDSAADLNNLFVENDIAVLPLIVNLGEESFLDGETISPDDIYAYVEKNNVLPKTAARNPEDFKEFFKSFTDDGYEVVHFSISSKLSLMCTSAKNAAAELPGVYVVDSQSLSTGIGLLALSAVDMAKQGKSAEEIYSASTKRVEKVQASFVVHTMEYLYKGGRCSGLTSLAATTLKIKPSLIVKNGEIIVYNKYFSLSGKRAIRKYLTDILQDYHSPDLTRVFITHSSVEDEVVQTVKDTLIKAGFKDILVTVAGATITSHCGKGTLGVLFINDAK